MSVFKESVVSPIEYHQLLPYDNLYLQREGFRLVENFSTKTDITKPKPFIESFSQLKILLSQSDSRNSSKKKARLKFKTGLLSMTESIVNYAVSALESVLQVTSNLFQKTDYGDYYKNNILVKYSSSKIARDKDKNIFANQLTQSFNKELLGDYYNDVLVEDLSRKIARDKDKNIFVNQLIQSFDKELLEDGYFHPSQEIIAQGLISSHDSVSQWLLEIYNNNLKANPSLSASLLKSISRFDFAEVYPWGFMMASLGILENSLEIRGAAVDCFENWGNEQSLEKLKAHVNQEQVPWLRDYISQVIVDISSEQKEMELEISGS